MQLAAGMRLAAVTMRTEMVHGGAEATLNGAAIGLVVGTRNSRQARTAVGSPNEAHRDGTNGGAAHQGQHDAA